jgi:hypothetical protein
VHAPTEDKCDDTNKKKSFCEEPNRAFDRFQKCYMKIRLGEFTEKVSREDIFKPTILNESLCETSKDKIGKVYSLKYNDILKVSFTPNHARRCCTKRILSLLHLRPLLHRQVKSLLRLRSFWHSCDPRELSCNNVFQEWGTRHHCCEEDGHGRARKWTSRSNVFTGINFVRQRI